MPAHGLDSPAFEHHDPIRNFERVQSMRDQNRRSTLRELSERRVNLGFALGVDLAREFIQKQDAWISQDGAG